MGRSVSLSRYIAGNLGLIVFPLLVASAVSFIVLTHTAREYFADVNRLNATLASARFDEFFVRPKGALSHISSVLEDVRPGYLERTLDEGREEYPFLDRIQVIGPDHRVFAVSPSDPALEGISREGESVYEKTRRSTGISWSDSYISTLRNQPALTFGRRIGVYTVLCDLNLDWLETFSASMKAFESSGMQVRVTDRNGVFLSSPEPGAVERRERQKEFEALKGLAAGSGFGELRIDGAVWLVSIVRVTGPDWFVIMLLPESVLTESLFGLVAGLLGVAAFGAGFVALFWRQRFKRIENILASISTQAERISVGDYAPLGNFGGGFVEFERVGHSLDLMITAIGEREITLGSREKGFREILERIDLPAVNVDCAGLIMYANPDFLQLLERKVEELTGAHITTIVAGDSSKCPFVLKLSGAAIKPVERCRLRTRSGGERIIDWSIVPLLDKAGALAGLTGIGHDMTNSILQQTSLEQSLREKEVLLRELFHRTRNNMQVIIGILMSEAERANNVLVDEVIGKTNSRIMSMSMVHKKLYESQDLSKIDLGDYCRELIDFLGAGEPGKDVWVTFRNPGVPVPVLIDSAVPVGLVLHELVTNALRHAYAGIPGGEIRVMIGLTPDNVIVLEVADDGIGLPAGFDTRDGDGLGFKLIYGLVEMQLQGTVTFTTNRGLVCTVRFSDEQTLKRI